MSDTARGPGWWLASDGKWYPPEAHPAAQAPTITAPSAVPGAVAPPASRTGMSGCAKALIVGGIVAAVAVVGVIVLLVVVVGRGVDTLNKKVVGVAGRPASLPAGEKGYPGMLKRDRVAGENGAVRLAGYTTTAAGWARTRTTDGTAVICGDVTMHSPLKQGETSDVGAVLAVVGAENWSLLTPSGVDESVSSGASDFNALANFLARGQVGGTARGKVCFPDPGESGRHVVTWRPRLFNAERAVWLVKL